MVRLDSIWQAVCQYEELTTIQQKRAGDCDVHVTYNSGDTLLAVTFVSLKVSQDPSSSFLLKSSPTKTIDVSSATTLHKQGSRDKLVK